MAHELLIPSRLDDSLCHFPKANRYSSLRVETWIRERLERTRAIFSQKRNNQRPLSKDETYQYASHIKDILIGRIFNYQSRTKIDSIIPQIEYNFVRQLNRGEPLNFFLLYNGGYRASPFKFSPLIFEPDHTELMLTYQVALLQEKISAIYSPGIKFFIVINNGVSLWVNDIPLDLTETYASKFRLMINWLGAAHSLHIVLQSELSNFTINPKLGPINASNHLDKKNHQLVERFLGRSCSLEEANFRYALYPVAEAKWAHDLLPMIHENGGLLLRQVAHPATLSFRPFPGGATRIQNGTLGFQDLAGKLVPKLITSQTDQQYVVNIVKLSTPWIH